MDDSILTRGPLEEAVAEFERLQARYNDLVATHPEVFETFFELTEDMNRVNDRVRALIRQAPYDLAGPFRKTSSHKETVDVELLKRHCPEAEYLDGLFEVVVKINTPILRGYVADGTITQEALDAATLRSEEPTVRVYGPKKFNIE